MKTFADGSPIGAEKFEDRRSGSQEFSGNERRQFGNSHSGLSPEAKELAEAIDAYKVKNRRRYVTFEEMLQVIHSLGYSKQEVALAATSEFAL